MVCDLERELNFPRLVFEIEILPKVKFSLTLCMASGRTEETIETRKTLIE